MGIPASHLLTVRILLVLSAIGITYGSLYPFQWSIKPIGMERALATLVSGWRGELGIPNIFANIVLFIPFGLFGWLSLANTSRSLRWMIILFSAVLLAVGLQVIQLWLSHRTPTIADAIINISGLLIGILMAQVPLLRSAILGLHVQADRTIALPLLLMLAWVAYRWFPYVPTFDVQAIKDGLKPLLLHPELKPFNLFHNLIAWLVFAFLWHQCRFKESLLWLVIPAIVLAQAGIADNPLSLHNVLAAIAAPPLWFLCKTAFRRPSTVLLTLLITMLFVQGLRPFEWGHSGFHWIPFRGFLTGNMMINTMSLLEKLFLYGSLVWLTLVSTHSRVAALILPILVTASIEAIQVNIPVRVAEITDPLLCVLFWLTTLSGGESFRATGTRNSINSESAPSDNIENGAPSTILRS